MWLAAAGDSNNTPILVAVIGGFATVFVAVVTGLFAFRGSARNSDTEREKNFDEQRDAEINWLRARNQTLETELTAERARVNRARYQLSIHQIDPSILD